ncbi:MAG TPA: hypothetical protein VK986_10380, partial [Tepidisphaeraceae bacterium]|nr:hypothetical protein [Tepidisphaeraceae bacterium]
MSNVRASCAWIAVTFLALAALPGGAAPPAPAGDPAYWDAYHRAMRELREGDWPAATATLTAAEATARGDRRLLMARGIARTLNGDFEAARDDLGRAKSNETREPTLWLAAVSAMTDDLRIGGDIAPPVGPPRRRGPNQPREAAPRPVAFGGVPGHLITGGKDYATEYSYHVIYGMALPYRKGLEARQPIDPAVDRKARHVAGRWFANRILASADLASRNFAWATQLARDGSLATAAEILQLARAVYRLDPDMAAAAGDLWLRAGRPATARAQYTIALTANVTLSPA